MASIIDSVSALPVCVRFTMAVAAHKFQIAPCQCNRRIIDVFWRQLDLVVHDLSGNDETFCQAAFA